MQSERHCLCSLELLCDFIRVLKYIIADSYDFIIYFGSLSFSLRLISVSPSPIFSSCASLSSFLSLGPPNCGLFVFAMHFIIVSIMCFERRLCVLSRPDWTNCTSNSLLNDLQSLCVQSDWFMNNILNSMLSTSNNKTDNLLDYIFSVFPFFRYFFWIDSGLRKCAKLKRYMATMVAN